MSVEPETQVTGTTRRRFVRDAGVATLAAADLLTAPAIAAPWRRRARRPTVAVFGGGVAGLTAAHELAERGFDVTVYERRAWGGKARSTIVPNTGSGGRKPLPGEHAFRLEFGCYENLADTMRRIPFGSNPNGVFDNMVPVPQVGFFREGKANVVLPVGNLDPRPYTPQQVLDLIEGLAVEMQIPPVAAAYFANRLAVFMSSCDTRRLDDWDRVSWPDFIGADRFGDDYRKVLGNLPQFIQASKSKDTCTRYIALVLEAFIVYPIMGRGTNGAPIRMFDRPTNEAWIDPWMSALRDIGVRTRLHHVLTGFETKGGRISAARVRTPWGSRIVTADHYVCALPVERARRLWTPAILKADPKLRDIGKLGVAWMNGLSFFLSARADICDGTVDCVDSPWALTFVTQAQLWSADFATTYGDGRAHEKLSAAIADWTTPGVRYGKPATDCTPDEVALDTWEQIKRHVNKPGAEVLSDRMLLSWDIDQGMRLRSGHLVSEDPLVLPTVGTGQYKPGVTTALPNLILAGDYLDSPWEIANMEATSHNGRRAANAILERAGSRETPAKAAAPYRPPEWEPFKRIDEQRYAQGQPNVFDLPVTPPEARALLRARA